jgi:hypothetical protein
MTADVISTEHTARMMVLFISLTNRMCSGGHNNDNKSIHRTEDEIETSKYGLGMGNPDATYTSILFHRFHRLALQCCSRLTFRFELRIRLSFRGSKQ